MNASDVLDSWGNNDDKSILFQRDVEGVEEFSINDARRYIDIEGEFGDSCSIYLRPDILVAGRRTVVRRLGAREAVDNVKLCVLKLGGGVKINVGGGNNRVFVGIFGDIFNCDINIWNNSNVFIGSEATCNYARIVLDNSNVYIGYDSMLSDEIIVQSSDQHGIVDLNTMAIINGHTKTIRIGRHVWIGRRSMIMPGCDIGDGSLVAAGAVVTSNIEKCTICAGVPARSVRQNVSWSRSPTKVSSSEVAAIRSFGE